MRRGHPLKLLLASLIIICCCSTEASTATAQFTGQLDPTNLSEYIMQLQLLSLYCESFGACPANAECNNYNSCECKHGYISAADQKNCVHRLPPNEDGSDPYDLPPRHLKSKACVDASSYCGPHASCDSGAKVCVCNPGYKADADQSTCRNVNPGNSNSGAGAVFAKTLMVLAFVSFGLLL